MLKKLSTIIMFFALFTVAVNAQWEYQGAWPDTNHKGGAHGVVVTPDGKIWTASYYQTLWPAAGVNTSPIIIFNEDGTVDDTIFTVTTGGITDTLGVGGSTSGTRGMEIDNEGNVYFVSSGPNKVIKINYQTRQGMARRNILPTEVGSSPAGPAISDDGTVFIGPVVGGGESRIGMFDTDLEPLGDAVLAPPNIVRTFEVSDDGLTIYWTMFTGSQGINIYQRASIFSSFELVDSALYGMSIETAAWHPVTGYLWVSNDARGTDSNYTHLTWYAFDTSTKTLVDSFTLPSPDPVPADELPRALTFSPDGSTAYVGLFGNKYPRLFKFTGGPVSVKPEPNTVAEDYTLSQNYPNPFNPSTEIKFAVKDAGHVTLRVFDILGKEVAVLVNETLNNGAYSVKFDASNLSSGTYIYQLSVNGNQLTKKMLLMK